MILSRKNYPASSFAHWLFFYGEIYRNPRFFLVSTVVSAHSFPSTNSKNWNFWVIRGVLGHLQFLTSQLHVFHRSFSKIVHVMVAKLRNNLIPVLVLRIGPFGISADFYPLCCLLCGRRVQWLDGALNRRDDSAVGYQTFCLKLGWQLSRSGWEAVFGAVAGLHSRFPEAVSWGLGFSFNVPGHQVSCFFFDVEASIKSSNQESACWVLIPQMSRIAPRRDASSGYLHSLHPSFLFMPQRCPVLRKWFFKPIFSGLKSRFPQQQKECVQTYDMTHSETIPMTYLWEIWDLPSGNLT